MEHYGTLEAANAYHLALGNSGWTGDNALKTAALVRATIWIDRTFRDRFPGAKAGGRAQVLEWPREEVLDSNGIAIDDDEVPIEIEHAAYEAALREIISPGSLSPDVSGREIKREKKKLGPLEKEIEYADGSTDRGVLMSGVLRLLENVLGVDPSLATTTVSSFYRA